MRDLIERISDDLGLSAAERAEQIPSGGVTIIASRVHWAKTYLKQAGLVEQPKRGLVTISDKGRALLDRPDGRPVTLDMLRADPVFQAFLARTKPRKSGRSGGADSAEAQLPVVSPVSETPEELIEQAAGTLAEALRESLLARILEATPSFFERMIIDLLLKMGYGGSRLEAGEQLGRSGDGGVDGVIREDRLGLDRIYLQAKRYQPGNTIGSETVQAFLGALVNYGAQKGVLITTSGFSKAARDKAAQSGHLRLILIDGDELTRLLIRFGVGVRVASVVEIKKIDLDYFDESEPE